jgi:hypothetical protein
MRGTISLIIFCDTFAMTLAVDEQERLDQIQAAPAVIQKLYGAVESGTVTELDSTGVCVNGTKYGELKNGTPIPDEGIDFTGGMVKLYTEQSLHMPALGNGEVGITCGIDECTVVVWRVGDQIFVVHNVNREVTDLLRAHVAAMGGEYLMTQPIVVLKQALTAQVDSSVLHDGLIDEVLVIGKYPEEIQAYFERSGAIVRFFKVSPTRSQPYDVWVQNAEGKIRWGMISAPNTDRSEVIERKTPDSKD